MFKENLKSQNSRNKKDDKGGDSQWSVFSLAMEMGYLIAIPLVVLALGGRFLDEKLGTSPWILLLGIGIAIFLSTYMVYKKTMSVINEQ